MSDQGTVHKKGPHQGQRVYSTGKPLQEAQAAMILVHGRGATAPSILELANVLPHPELAYLAPQATGNSWYPYSFLAPITQNEPQLSSALAAIGDAVAQLSAAGIANDRIIIGGFSQGACLASEFVARTGVRFGGLLVFSGGLIGPPDTPRDYRGDLTGMPVFLGCSNVDAHIPEARVHETADVLAGLGAQVDKQIYPNMGHTIIQDELDRAQRVIAQLAV
ncbi:MAG TPA: dienelactone hydrolase family protein [Caldilineaceae bacterium]|nr:dienelactone hydrolase family protein [Caldilineaceae bacterium]